MPRKASVTSRAAWGCGGIRSQLRVNAWLTPVDAAGAGFEAPHRPIPLIPIQTQIKLAAILEADYEMALNKGEFLMKRQLDLFIRSRRFFDNARPPFLASPASNHPVEYDRYYLDGVAFEFNGSQHFVVLGQGGAEDKAAQETRTRDMLKAGLSKEAGIELIVVTAQDLRPGALEKLIPARAE